MRVDLVFLQRRHKTAPSPDLEVDMNTAVAVATANPEK